MLLSLGKSKGIGVQQNANDITFTDKFFNMHTMGTHPNALVSDEVGTVFQQFQENLNTKGHSEHEKT